MALTLQIGEGLISLETCSIVWRWFCIRQSWPCWNYVMFFFSFSLPVLFLIDGISCFWICSFLMHQHADLVIQFLSFLSLTYFTGLLFYLILLHNYAMLLLLGECKAFLCEQFEIVASCLNGAFFWNTKPYPGSTLLVIVSLYLKICTKSS